MYSRDDTMKSSAKMMNVKKSTSLISKSSADHVDSSKPEKDLSR